MHDFKLTDGGDIEILHDEIQTTSGSNLLAQQLKMILNTNKGEWWLDEEEGIPFKEILLKNPNYDAIKDYIQYAAKQIDQTIELSDFSCEWIGRTLTVKFSANGEQAAVQFSV